MLMKKIILFGIGAICLLTLVYAFSVGDILTQEQVDAINTDTISLNSQWVSVPGNTAGFYTDGINIYRKFKHRYFEPIEENYRFIEKKNKVYVMPYINWGKCKTRDSVADCYTAIKVLSNIALTYKEPIIRSKIKDIQTKETIDLS